MLNKDYKEMLQCLLEEKVKFLLVGAYAVAVHGYPRATKDIDFFVWAVASSGLRIQADPGVTGCLPMAAAINSGNRSGVQANAGAPNAASCAASWALNDGAPSSLKASSVMNCTPDASKAWARFRNSFSTPPSNKSLMRMNTV